MLLMEMIAFITVNKMLLSLLNRNQFFTEEGESESANTTIAVWSQKPFLRPRRSQTSLLKTLTPRGRCQDQNPRLRLTRRKRKRMRTSSSLKGTSVTCPHRTFSGVDPLLRGSLKTETNTKIQMMLMVCFAELLLTVVFLL